MGGRNPWTWTTGILLCIAVALSYIAVDQYNRAETYRQRYEATLEELKGLTITVDILIDYGNGTAIWLNDTRIPLGANLLMATEMVASVDYIEGEYGAFVTAINGVGGEPNRYWLWFYLKDGCWEMGPVACDAWNLQDGDVVAWRYTSFS